MKNRNFFFPFLSSFVDIGWRSNASFWSVTFLFLFSLAAVYREKNETSDSDISTPRERESYLSTIRESSTRKKERKKRRKHLTSPSTQKRKTDRRLTGASDSFPFFSSVRLLLHCYCLQCDVLTCVFPFSSSLLSVSLSLSVACCTSTSFTLSVTHRHDYYPFGQFTRLLWYFLNTRTE